MFPQVRIVYVCPLLSVCLVDGMLCEEDVEDEKEPWVHVHVAKPATYAAMERLSSEQAAALRAAMFSSGNGDVTDGSSQISNVELTSQDVSVASGEVAPAENVAASRSASLSLGDAELRMPGPAD